MRSLRQAKRSAEPQHERGARSMSKYGVKLYRGSYKELTLFLGRLQLRFSIPQVAAWWEYKQLYSFGRGHRERN